MKLLDVLGTNSEIFSLGLGEKKIELRSIDGVLHFRNFGTGWQRASSESLRESLRLRIWSPGLLIGERELFLYNGSIWYSKNTLTASINFIDDSNSFVKIFDATNFSKFEVSSISTLNLTTETSDSIYFTGESNLNFISVYLPNAQTLNVGRQLLFINEVLIPIRVYPFGNTSSYFNLGSLSSLGLILTDNSTTEGEWSTLSFSGGSGGSGGVYQLDVTITPPNIFSQGDFAYYNTATQQWSLAYSDNFSLDSLGIITNSGGNKIRVAFFGLVEFENALLFNGNPIIPGQIYYLADSSNPGKFTNSPGVVNKKLFIAISTNSIFLFNSDESARFDEQKIYSLSNGQSVIISEAYSYSFNGYIEDDPNLTIFNGYIYYSSPSIPVDALIETSSDIISESDSSNSLCFFMDGNNLRMKNNLNANKNIIIYRKKIK